MAPLAQKAGGPAAEPPEKFSGRNLNFAGKRPLSERNVGKTLLEGTDFYLKKGNFKFSQCLDQNEGSMFLSQKKFCSGQLSFLLVPIFYQFYLLLIQFLALLTHSVWRFLCPSQKEIAGVPQILGPFKLSSMNQIYNSNLIFM